MVYIPCILIFQAIYAKPIVIQASCTPQARYLIPMHSWPWMYGGVEYIYVSLSMHSNDATILVPQGVLPGIVDITPGGRGMTIIHHYTFLDLLFSLLYSLSTHH